MPACNTAIRELYAQLNALHVRECELDLRLSQEISTALAHYGPNIQALDGTDPLDANFIALYYQLALRRIEQFKQEISERTCCLNCSVVVQGAQRLLGVDTIFQCDLSVTLDQEGSCPKEESAQQINMAFLHLMMFNKLLLHQLKELMHTLDAWTNDKATEINRGVSDNSHSSRAEVTQEKLVCGDVSSDTSCL